MRFAKLVSLEPSDGVLRHAVLVVVQASLAISMLWLVVWGFMAWRLSPLASGSAMPPQLFSAAT